MIPTEERGVSVHPTCALDTVSKIHIREEDVGIDKILGQCGVYINTEGEATLIYDYINTNIYIWVSKVFLPKLYTVLRVLRRISTQVDRYPDITEDLHPTAGINITRRWGKKKRKRGGSIKNPFKLISSDISKHKTQHMAL